MNLARAKNQADVDARGGPRGAGGWPGAARAADAPATQWWNFHALNGDIFQWQPSFPARYSGPNSLSSSSQTSETVDLDALAGLRLWRGAELHVDGLFWQGFGRSKTLGVEAFPSASAYKIGNNRGNFALTRAFVRQTINLGGAEQSVADDSLHLAGKQDAARVVLTLGEISVLDIFDNNAYAGEFYEPGWAFRYGFFQMPQVANGMGIDKAYVRAWGMILEVERDFHFGRHPGAIRLGGFLNRADMGSYSVALESAARPADIAATRSYRYKHGFTINAEQEVFDHIGLFLRAGWNDGHEEGWIYSDVNRTS